MAVSDWSTTPGNNSSVGGADISEGCSPAGINDALRAIMAEARAEFDLLPRIANNSEDITGNWTVSGAWTFSGAQTFSGTATFDGAAAFNASVTMTGTAPQLSLVDSDTSNTVHYRANDNSGVWDVDPSAAVAGSEALIRVDATTIAQFSDATATINGTLTATGNLTTSGQLEAASMGSTLEGLVDARVAAQATEWELVSSQSPTSGSAVSWTGLSAYRELRLVFFSLTATGSDEWRVQVSDDNGATWKTTGYTGGAGTFSATNGFRMNGGLTNIFTHGWMEFFDFNSASSRTFSTGSFGGAIVSSGYEDAAAAGDAIRILLSAETFTSGSVALYGRA